MRDGGAIPGCVCRSARGIWRDSHADALADAVAPELASWDASKRTYFLAVPVSIERRGEPPAPPEYVYPSRRPRHREAWNEEDIALLRKMARAGNDPISVASRLAPIAGSNQPQGPADRRALQAGLI